MAVLCQLANPRSYRVSTWNLMDDPQVARYWLDLFASFPGRFDKHLLEDGLAGDRFDVRWRAFEIEYDQTLRQMRSAAAESGELTTIDLCRFRQAMLDKHGFRDPYAGVKQRENDMAARIFPSVVAQIEQTVASGRWELLLRGMLAGNMFDLGSPETIDMYHHGQAGFFSFFDHVPPRPWFVDDADALIVRLEAPSRWRQALFFVDNAGADIVLGVLPVARELARMGIRVVLAANASPALNDITIGELGPLLERVAGGDAVLQQLLAEDRLSTVDSGGDTPLLDLSRVSDACNEVAAESDLVVLQGMGRAVESNWTEEFRCDVWRIAMLKDRTVVQWRGAKLFDAGRTA